MTEPSQVTIASEPVASRYAQYCLRQYYRELQERFEEGFEPTLSLAPSLGEFAPPRGVFLVAWLCGEAVGCGGFKPVSAEAAYIKRMWISPRARGHGLGKRLLLELETRALGIGYSVTCLETNKALHEAQNLYRSAGYVEVEPFNDEPYAHHWFQKRLIYSPNG